MVRLGDIYKLLWPYKTEDPIKRSQLILGTTARHRLPEKKGDSATIVNSGVGKSKGSIGMNSVYACLTLAIDRSRRQTRTTKFERILVMHKE
jgi:hypothetical protein